MRIFSTLIVLATLGSTAQLPSEAEISQEKAAPPAVEKQTADAATAPREWLVVPVFFATNRNFAGESGGIAYSEEPNSQGLLFGVKNIAAPIPVHTSVDKDTEKRMSWQRMVKEPKIVDPSEPPAPPDVDPSKCTVRDRTLEREEIVPAFISYMKDSGSKETVIFVHGCCANFDKSMQRAATIAAYMQVPVLLYDWVSPKGFKKYLENETRLEQTVDDFCRFLYKVEKLSNPSNITLMGHSMGTRFVDQSMVMRSQRALDGQPLPKFKELILSNADSDAKSFLNHAKEFTMNAEKNRIYFNTKDEVMDYSSTVHGRFPRLGNPGPLLSELTKTEGIELVDITQNNSKHEIPFWIVANLHRFNNLGKVKEFELKHVSPGLISVERTELSKGEEPVQTISECACDRAGQPSN
jgi:esterase/lipase superfamily enzyme